MTQRQDFDSYFMDIAKVVATRATCPRKSVGTVLVRDRRILCTGYNGSPAGAVHCTEAGCLIDNNHCVRTIHAELNAIISAAKDGVSIAYSTAYITSKPCLNCLKSLINAGVKKIFFAEDYGDVDYSVLGMNNNVMPDIVMLGPTGRTPVNIRDAGRSRHD